MEIGRVEPRTLTARRHPVGVAPVVGQVPQDRSGPRRHFGAEGEGVGLLQHRSRPRRDGEFVDITRRGVGDHAFPDPRPAAHLEDVGAGIPRVEVTDDADLAWRSAPTPRRWRLRPRSGCAPILRPRLRWLPSLKRWRSTSPSACGGSGPKCRHEARASASARRTTRHAIVVRRSSLERAGAPASPVLRFRPGARDVLALPFTPEVFEVGHGDRGLAARQVGEAALQRRGGRRGHVVTLGQTESAQKLRPARPPAVPARSLPPPP